MNSNAEQFIYDNPDKSNKKKKCGFKPILKIKLTLKKYI